MGGFLSLSLSPFLFLPVVKRWCLLVCDVVSVSGLLLLTLCDETKDWETDVKPAGVPCRPLCSGRGCLSFLLGQIGVV